MPLAVDAHVRYIQGLNTRQDQYAYWLTEHLRLSGLYWGLASLFFVGRPDALPRDDTVEFVMSCQCANGGFAAAPGHDAHMLYTVSAVQILAMTGALDRLDSRVVTFIASLQRDSGTFAGDEWGEEDTRFLYGALNALSLLGRLDAVDVDKAADYVAACANFDGGYGVRPGAESHAGQVFTCLAALAIAGRLHTVDADTTGRWLSERQVPGGGLNGRPEKKEDVCYSWWVLSSLALVGRLHWIDRDALVAFILDCQDPDGGGFADRPGNMADVWHTVYALAGLGLLGYKGIEPVHPAYCMPQATIDRVIGAGALGAPASTASATSTGPAAKTTAEAAPASTAPAPAPAV